MRFPVTLDIKPSRRLRAALVFVHLGAIAVLWIGAIPALLATAASGLAGLSFCRCCWRQGLPLRLRLCADGSLLHVAGDDEPVRMEVLPGATVYRWLVVIRLRRVDTPGAMSVVVLADSLASGDFRLLRVWLRWLAGVRASGERA